MTEVIRPAHYVYSEEMKARYKSEAAATPEAFMRRALAFDLHESLATRPRTPSLVSSTYGPIEAVLMTLPRYVFLYPSYAEPLRDLLRRMPPSCQFFILVSAGHRRELESWLAAANAEFRATIVEAPASMQFTVWAEDAYVAVRDTAGDGGTSANRHLVEPATFRRADDALIADEMAKGTSLFQSQVPLYFQGGNILVGDDFWLLGMDYAIESLRLGYVVPRPDETRAAAIERAYGHALDHGRTMSLIGSSLVVPTETQVPIVINGERWLERVYAGNNAGTTQPLFHIDMFITLAGRGAAGKQVVLVGDPKAAAEVLGMPLSPYAMHAIFDDIAAQLAAGGFEVVRNPLPLVYQDEPREKVRYWYFATANNALVQTVEGDRHVWLPTYGHGAWPELEATDIANADIWQALGYSVHSLGDFHPFAFNLGAVHCITKYLGRRSGKSGETGAREKDDKTTRGAVEVHTIGN